MGEKPNQPFQLSFNASLTELLTQEGNLNGLTLIKLRMIAALPLPDG